MPQGSTKGRLINAGDPNDQLIFQYNPTNIKERKNTQWAEADIPGGDDELATFGSGKSLQLDMQLFFNIYGESQNDAPVSSGFPFDENYVENCLQFLYRFAEIAGVAPGPGQFPGILLLSLGGMRFPGGLTTGIASLNAPVLPVRVAQVTVDRQLFKKDTFKTLRATAALRLTRVTGFPR
jgi:hypothetical protein